MLLLPSENFHSLQPAQSTAHEKTSDENLILNRLNLKINFLNLEFSSIQKKDPHRS